MLSKNDVVAELRRVPTSIVLPKWRKQASFTDAVLFEEIHPKLQMLLLCTRTVSDMRVKGADAQATIAAVG